MPLTLEELQSLVTGLGVQVPANIIAEKTKTQEFKARVEKISAQGAGKPADWRLKADFNGVLIRAADSAKKKQFDSALKLLDEAEQILQQPDAQPETEPIPEAPPTAPQETRAPDGKFSIVELQKSRVVWDGLRKSVRTQLEQLEKSLIASVQAHNSDEAAEDEFDESEVAAAVKNLHTILGQYDQQLIDKLDQALNAKTDDLRRSAHKEAAGIIKDYQSFVAKDTMLAIIDDNGFTKSTIRTEVIGALTELAGKF